MLPFYLQQDLRLTSPNFSHDQFDRDGVDLKLRLVIFCVVYWFLLKPHNPPTYVSTMAIDSNESR